MARPAWPSLTAARGAVLYRYGLDRFIRNPVGSGAGPGSRILSRCPKSQATEAGKGQGRGRRRLVKLLHRADGRFCTALRKSRTGFAPVALPQSVLPRTRLPASTADGDTADAEAHGWSGEVTIRLDDEIDNLQK